MSALAFVFCCAAHAERTVDTALRRAAEAGDMVSIQQLISQGADPDKADALIAAIRGGQRPALDYLLEHGADPNAWTHGRSLLPAGAYGSPVFQAAKLGNRPLLQDLKAHGADLNAASQEKVKPAGDTPLITAARSGELEAARLLIQSGADVKHANPDGDTALMQAISAPSNSLQLVKLLLDSGADPDTRNAAGKSARDFASWYGVSGIKETIQQHKPIEPVTAPEDLDEIGAVLVYKAACDLSSPDYRKRTAAAYDHWQAPRAKAIRQIESNSDFVAQRASAVEKAKRVLAAPQDSAEYPGSLAEYRSLCDVQLIREFAGQNP